MKDRTLMNTLSTSPIPYYNHFLYKESLDLKNALIQSARDYKMTASRLKECLRKFERLNHSDLEPVLMNKLTDFQNALESTIQNLRKQDDILFDLQKSLQSNKVYDENFQKALRSDCKSNLKSMKDLQNYSEDLLEKSEEFLNAVVYNYLPEKNRNKSSFDWISNLQILVSPEKRIIRKA